MDFCRHIRKVFLPLTVSLVAGTLMVGMAFSQRTFQTRYVAQQLGLQDFIPQKSLNDPDQMLAFQDSLDRVQKPDTLSSQWINLQYFRCNAWVEKREGDRALKLARRMVKKVKGEGNTFLYRMLLLNLAEALSLNSETGFGEETVNGFLAAMELAREAGDRQMEFDLCLRMAGYYIEVERRDLTSEWVERAHSILPDIYDAVNCHFYYLCAADASNPSQHNPDGTLRWNTKEEEDKAFAMINQGIACSEQVAGEGKQSEINLPLAYHIRADFWRNPDDHVYWFRRTLRASTQLGDRWAMFFGNNRLSAAYLTANKLDSARLTLDSARALAREFGDQPELLSRVYNNYVRYYEKAGHQPDSLIKYLKLSKQVDMVASQQEALVQLELNKSKFQDVQQKLTILQQKGELEARNRAQYNMLMGGAVLAFILLLVVFFLIRIRIRNRLIQKKNNEIEHINQQLARGLDEKEALIHEVNHRVKNNLQMISAFVDMQGQYLDQEESRAFAEGIRNRVRAVSLVHELIMEDDRLLGMDFNDYAKELMQELESLHFRGNTLECHLDIADVRFGMSTTMYLGILLNELVSNSMKYAVKEGEELHIWISLQKHGPGLKLLYRDSGGGFKTENIEKKGKRRSIGLMLVDAMARQLGGKLHYEQQGGGEYQLVFPSQGLED
ncbi:MAG: sensor histidine kinase [Bacteroidia bacterium]|nr:sensor histidine kinase [Bacteroidia bacterium]